MYGDSPFARSDTLCTTVPKFCVARASQHDEMFGLMIAFTVSMYLALLSTTQMIHETVASFRGTKLILGNLSQQLIITHAISIQPWILTGKCSEEGIRSAHEGIFQ